MRVSPRVFDLVLAAAVTAGAVVEVLLAAGIGEPRWPSVVIAIALGSLLLVRRRHPVLVTVPVMLLTVPESLFFADTSELIASFLPLLVLAYGGGAYVESRGAYAALALLLASIVPLGAIDGELPGSILFPAVITVLCWLIGRNVRTRTRLAAELHEGAARLAEQREAEARDAVAQERRRIAREMHDVVAHSISIMVVQAAGARQILARDPGRAEEAARRIGHAGRDALGEMHLLVGALERMPSAAPAPSADALATLVERARDAGQAVTLRVQGTPRALPHGAELAAYRVVQEGLTNAIKHAAGAATEVDVTWARDALELRVADSGDGGAGHRLQGGGHGLVGMAERVRLHGGELHAGPRGGGGFEVVARIPLGAGPPP